MSELLAPAGSPEAVFAAVRCGANAVYLAGEAFNARRNATNFTDEQLQEAVRYCHLHGVKVYHALNTLVKDSEITALQAEIERILTLGEDALILQDPGVAAIVRQMCPEMPLHASTQMSAHSLAGVQALEQLGFRRVVLAREMSFEEMRYVRENTAVELEVFVHGALCMCVSGQCLMSSFFGARSGNRGLCAQPCRLPFCTPRGTDYALSLKDNSLLEHLPALEALGIDSFKIEGRMKRPEYVAASVCAGVHAKSGAYTPLEEQNLKNIFSRQGFTDGYFTACRGKEMFGARTREDVSAASPKLLREYAQSYAKERQDVACDITFSLSANALPALQMCSRGEQVCVFGQQLPEKALHRPLSEEALRERLSKLGGTPFFAKNISLSLESGLVLSAAEINRMRREAADALAEKLAQSKPYTYRSTLPPLPAQKVRGKKQLFARFADIAQAQQVPPSIEKIILPIEQAAQAVAAFGTQRLILETPRAFFGKQEHLTALLDEAKALGVKEIAVGNIGAVHLAKQRGFRILASLGMNVFNSYACAQLPVQSILLSPEMSTAQIAAIISDKAIGSIVYGHLPLMITRNCPLHKDSTCAQCDKHGYLTDRKGEKMPVRCRFGCSEIFNPHALYMLDKMPSLQTDFALLYFTTENAAQIRHIFELCRTRQAPDIPFTRGLYTKGVM